MFMKKKCNDVFDFGSVFYIQYYIQYQVCDGFIILLFRLLEKFYINWEKYVLIYMIKLCI